MNTKEEAINMEITSEEYKNIARIAIFTWALYAGVALL